MQQRKVFSAFVIAAFLCAHAACADEPSDPSQQNAGSATVIFFRIAHFEGSGITGRIRIDDKDVAEIGNGSVATVKSPSGQVVFEIDNPLDFGHLDFPMTLDAGKTYYVALAAKTGFGSMGGGAGYLLSNRDVDPASICQRGWCAAIVDRKDADPELQRLGFSQMSSDR